LLLALQQLTLKRGLLHTSLKMRQLQLQALGKYNKNKRNLV
jgi:hypothetical protein